MTAKRQKREIKRRILLKGVSVNISAENLAALLTSLTLSTQDPKFGFNHVTTDAQGWFASFAPYGVDMDQAFIEDMLYAANMLDEAGKFKHPKGMGFDDMLKTVLKSSEYFDKDTNEIKVIKLKGKK